VLFASFDANAWGYWAHRKINNKAIETLPKGMSGFYKYYIDYLTEHAVDPDKKRFCDMNEGPHHFIDLDHYCDYPCDSFPRYWKDAIAKYSEDTLNKYGVVPWYIGLKYYDLVHAFMDQDADRILKISANLGHYIADSYVPLHATINYDGQLTGQNGIHAFWESTVPEFLSYTYNYDVGPAKFINDVNKFTWTGILGSESEIDSVLTTERELLKSMPMDKIYCYEINRNNKITPTFSDQFIITYNTRLHDMAQRRLRSSIFAVGSLWMSAWVEAGQPDLDKLIGKATPDEKENDQ